MTEALGQTAVSDLLRCYPVLSDIADGKEIAWLNPRYQPSQKQFTSGPVTEAEVDEADARLKRFATLMELLFPETTASDGILESPLIPARDMRPIIAAGAAFEPMTAGELYMKLDSHMPISGSVKARGGIHEVLKYAEDLALEAGLLTGLEDDYRKLFSAENRKYFSGRRLQVGSTGNLGLSIGLMGAALGLRTTVHMSADAWKWKKDLLRSRGAEVVEYAGDYGEAVRCGRAESDADPLSYFVDDENSRDLLTGYAVAGRRLASQLSTAGRTVDARHPLFVYIPCGVGGAPAGIALGLRQTFGDAVHVFYVEPVQAPCMLVGLVSGLGNGISVQDIGLSGKTVADGLAVGRCSGLAASVSMGILSGAFTVSDDRLNHYVRALKQAFGVFVEPSAAAALQGYLRLGISGYVTETGLQSCMADSVHILWATGGSMVPEQLQQSILLDAD